MNERRIFLFRDKITSYGFARRNVNSDDLVSGSIQVGLDIDQRSVVRYTVPFKLKKRDRESGKVLHVVIGRKFINDFTPGNI